MCNVEQALLNNLVEYCLIILYLMKIIAFIYSYRCRIYIDLKLKVNCLWKNSLCCTYVCMYCYSFGITLVTKDNPSVLKRVYKYLRP